MEGVGAAVVAGAAGWLHAGYFLLREGVVEDVVGVECDARQESWRGTLLAM